MSSLVTGYLPGNAENPTELVVPQIFGLMDFQCFSTNFQAGKITVVRFKTRQEGL
jgi:hypothetical protein